MKPSNKKVVALTPPAAIVDNAAFVTIALDTKGFKYCEIFVLFGAMDIAATALKVQESDTLTDANTLASGADVTGLVYGTSDNIAGSASTLPSATSDNTIFKFEIDLRGRKRYLDLGATGGDGSAGSYMVAWAELSDPEVGLVTAAEKGCAQILRV